MTRLNKLIGNPVSRVEARLKVTGAVRFTADMPATNALVAYPVVSTIGSGSIRYIDTAKALKAEGVKAVLTHLNAPRLQLPTLPVPFPLDPFFVLQDNKINYYGQYIGVVVAETYEQARYAATLVDIQYLKDEGQYSFFGNFDQATLADRLLSDHLHPRESRGDPEEGESTGSVHVHEDYTTPYEHAYAIEPHVALAEWHSTDSFTIHSSAQQVVIEQQAMAGFFGVSPENVRVISRFVGGGFGSKSLPWQHIILAVMGARETARPVKLVVPRKYLTSVVGHRPYVNNHMRLSADDEGQLTFIGHYITSSTDKARVFIEHAGENTLHLYNSSHLEVEHNGVDLNVPIGTIVRAPGAGTGTFALEAAMDELAYKLGVDPIALRKINEPPQDPHTGLPWSSRNLISCMEQGAKAFGWYERQISVRGQHKGNKLFGQGMANAMYPANRQLSSAMVSFDVNGNVVIRLAATDLGTGTYTILSQVAAEYLGISVSQVTTQIGDSALPYAPGSGASVGAASWSNAVFAACRVLLQNFLNLLDSTSPLYGLEIGELVCIDGRIEHHEDSSRYEYYESIIARFNGSETVSAVAVSAPPTEPTHSSFAFGSHFAEVSVDIDTGEVRVERFVSRFACGRILNLKTATSQIKGGIIWGIGMALMEESVMDNRTGKFINSDLGGYHVPVLADIPDIDVEFIEELDEVINDTGVKGLGEVGLTGVAAAITNAIFHATGQRIRNLPVTPDKLLHH